MSTQTTIDETGSKLTYSQTRKFEKGYTENGNRMRIVATVRFDDECKNGHNTFAITADIYENNKWACGGCCHEEVAKHFPELAPLIKWHLVSTDGPMHYVANTVYHVLQHGPRRAWVYYTGESDPLGIGDKKERLVGYEDAQNAIIAEMDKRYRVVWDEKTAKVRNLDHARSSAAWPDATDEDLTAPGLEARLAARLPALMEEFKAAVESLGFTY